MQQTPNVRHGSQHLPGSALGSNVSHQHHWPSDDFSRGRASRHQRSSDLRAPALPVGTEVSDLARNVPVRPNAGGIIDDSPGEASSGEEMSATDEDRQRSGSHPKQSMTADQEELSLLFKRRKLLAKSDWLGLASTKPLRIQFPAVSDRDQVGRRRKIQEASQQRARSARPRLLTPIFEERLKPKDHLMSGVLPLERNLDLHIKIGTDAFASQSGFSRKSSTPANLSVRQPSTEFGSLSEESMLLGDDGDTFDANQVAIPAAMLSHRIRVPQDIDSMYPYPGSQLTALPTHLEDDATARRSDPFDHEADSPGILSDHRHNEDVADHESQASADSQCQEGQAASQGFGGTKPSGCTRESAIELPSDGESVSSARVDEFELDLQLEEPVTKSSRTVDHVSTRSSKMQLAWMQWLGVQQGHSSDESRAALVSSSEHLTTSEDLPRVNVEPASTSMHMQYDAEPISTPKGAGPQVSIVHHHNRCLEDEARISRSCSQSPSASLARIRNLAQQPGPEVGPLAVKYDGDDDDQDALWREFIIGSQTSEADESLPAYLVSHQHEDTGDLAGRTPSPDVSGLGTSDRATQGLSLFITDGPSHASGSTSRIEHAELTSSTTSGAGLHKFGSMEVEGDAIEDSPSTHRGPPKLSNIHADISLPLNARRSKKSQQNSRPAEKGDKTLPRRPSKGLRRGQRSGRRSTYDLVDSDETILA